MFNKEKFEQLTAKIDDFLDNLSRYNKQEKEEKIKEFDIEFATLNIPVKLDIPEIEKQWHNSHKKKPR